MIGPVLPSTGVLRPLGLDQVRLTGGFWGERQERNAAATIPHAVTGWIGPAGWATSAWPGRMIWCRIVVGVGSFPLYSRGLAAAEVADLHATGQ